MWTGDIIKIKVCGDVSTCVSEADLIVTATFYPRPYLMKDMIKKGAHQKHSNNEKDIFENSKKSDSSHSEHKSFLMDYKMNP